MNATITVLRTGSVTSSASVNYATKDGTAQAGSDYVATSGTLNFASGEGSTTFTIPLTDDKIIEGNESLSLILSGPTGGAALADRASVPLAIADTDVSPFGAGSFKFSAASYKVTEGHDALITVQRTNGTTGAATINYATSDGTAVAGSDYTPASGTLTFLPGEASKTVTVTIKTDAYSDSDETLRLTLSGPTGGAGLGSLSEAVIKTYD